MAKGALRLRDGPRPNEGRLEVNYNNLHGAVCDDHFDITDAATACHQLGFAGAERVVPCCQYGQRHYGEIWLDDLHCNSRDVWVGCGELSFWEGGWSQVQWYSIQDAFSINTCSTACAHICCIANNDIVYTTFYFCSCSEHPFSKLCYSF